MRPRSLGNILKKECRITSTSVPGHFLLTWWPGLGDKGPEARWSAQSTQALLVPLCWCVCSHLQQQPGKRGRAHVSLALGGGFRCINNTPPIFDSRWTPGHSFPLGPQKTSKGLAKAEGAVGVLKMPWGGGRADIFALSTQPSCWLWRLTLPTDITW